MGEKRLGKHLLTEQDAVPSQYLELEPVQDAADKPQDKPSSRSKSRGHKRTIIILSCCLVALITLLGAFYFVDSRNRKAEEIASQLAAEEAERVQQQREQAEYETLLSSNTFAMGVTVDDIPIGGMTMDAAKAALEPIIKKMHTLGELQLGYGDKLYSIDLNTVVVADDLDTVLEEAFKLGKTGEYATIKAELAAIEASGRAFSVHPGYDYSVLSQRVKELAEQIDTPMKDAGVANIDTETRTISFSDEVVGVAVQQETLIATITKAMQEGDLTPVEIPVIETKPVVTKATLETQYVMRSSATTDFSSSISARKFNIRKGAGMINGTVLKPGEVFSMNGTLGTRTEKNGWKPAGAYEGGMVVEQAGGGVCQLSSTLYNAVVKGDLKIVSRRNHSMPVAYVKEGLDATINSVGNIIDFQFSNNTTNDIVIFGYTVDNKKVTFEIWGVPFPETFDEIKLSSEKVATIKPEGEEVFTSMPAGTLLADGTEVVPGGIYVITTRRNGSEYQSYKTYYKGGAEVRTEKLAYSVYKAFTGETWVGPIIDATPTPNPDDPNYATPDPFGGYETLPEGAF